VGIPFFSLGTNASFARIMLNRRLDPITIQSDHALTPKKRAGFPRAHDLTDSESAQELKHARCDCWALASADTSSWRVAAPWLLAASSYGIGQRHRLTIPSVSTLEQCLREFLADLHDRPGRTQGRCFVRAWAGRAEQGKRAVCQSVVQKSVPLSPKQAEAAASRSALDVSG